MRTIARLLFTAVLLGGLGYVGWLVWQRLQERPEAAARSAARTQAAPVEVASIRIGRIERLRTISGTLEAPNELIVAPKIGGRVKALAVDVADEVRRGDVVCVLEDDELRQDHLQAQAEETVARANLTEAENGLEIAARGLARVEQLLGRGIASDVQHDQAVAEKLAKEAAVAVATARITRAVAAVEAARIRVAYAQVGATWAAQAAPPANGGAAQAAETRIVAERFVNEGDTVAANTPLLRIVQLDPILAVIQVTEKDYAHLEAAPPVEVTTDAFPGEVFQGTVARVSPVFDPGTRQARVELRLRNPQRRLKPGMFIRATLVLEAADDATIVPVAAVTERDDQKGVFVVVRGPPPAVRWRPVTLGIRQGDDVQVRGDGLVGSVVTLGQQLVKDGAAISIPGEADAGADVEPARE